MYIIKFAFRQCAGHFSFRTHNPSNTTNLIQSILLPCVLSIEYELPHFTQLIYLLWYHHWLTHCYIYSTCFLCTPHLHPIPTPWEATLYPPTFSLWRPGGLAGLACIGAPAARSRPGWSPILSGKGAPYKHIFWMRTPRPFLRRCSPPTGG